MCQIRVPKGIREPCRDWQMTQSIAAPSALSSEDVNVLSEGLNVSCEAVRIRPTPAVSSFSARVDITQEPWITVQVVRCNL